MTVSCGVSSPDTCVDTSERAVDPSGPSGPRSTVDHAAPDGVDDMTSLRGCVDITCDVIVMRMDITPYVDSLRRDLVAAAEAGGDDIKQAAERLMLALAPCRPAGPDGGDLPGRRRDHRRAARRRRRRTPRRPRARLRRPRVRADPAGRPRAAGPARRPRSPTRAGWPGSRSGSPSRSRPAPRRRRPGPATASTPGWSRSSAPRPATPPSTSTSTCRASRSTGFDPFRKGRGNRRMTGWL